jgi:protein phosphatase
VTEILAADPALAEEPLAQLVIPDPALVVLIGAAGTGKTTFARRHFAADAILSSDAFRAIVSGDEADQSATRVAFAILHRELGRRLAAGRLTVVDATNLAAFARRRLLGAARSANVPSLAVVLDLPDDVVVARNAGRAERSIPESVVRRHLAALHGSITAGSLAVAGFAAVHWIRSAEELDRVDVSVDGRVRPNL